MVEMKGYLCTSCGHVMGRFVGGCVVCNGQNIQIYSDMYSPILKERVRQIRGQRKPSSPLMSYLIIGVLTLGLYMAGVTVKGLIKGDQSGSAKAASKVALKKHK